MTYNISHFNVLQMCGTVTNYWSMFCPEVKKECFNSQYMYSQGYNDQLIIGYDELKQYVMSPSERADRKTSSKFQEQLPTVRNAVNGVRAQQSFSSITSLATITQVV